MRAKTRGPSREDSTLSRTPGAEGLAHLDAYEVYRRLEAAGMLPDVSGPGAPGQADVAASGAPPSAETSSGAPGVDYVRAVVREELAAMEERLRRAVREEMVSSGGTLLGRGEVRRLVAALEALMGSTDGRLALLKVRKFFNGSEEETDPISMKVAAALERSAKRDMRDRSK